MVDTIRTRAAILSLLADNSSGEISPQDVRDTVVSIFGVYGVIFVKDAGVLQGSLSTTPEKMTGFTSDGPAVGMTVSGASSKITALTNGTYLVSFQVSFQGTANETFTFKIRIDGAETDYGFSRSIPSGGGSDIASGSCFGIIPLLAGEAVEVYVESSAGSGDEITPTDAQLLLLKLS